MKRTRNVRPTTPSPGHLAVYMNVRFIPKGQVPSRRKRDQHQTIPARQALANKLAYDLRRQPGTTQPRVWVDCGLGASTAAIIDNCEQLTEPGDTLARSVVVSLDPALEALLPADQRAATLASIIEQTLQNGYQDLLDVATAVPYSYVLHDPSDRYGRARTHAHITLPGGFTDPYTGQFHEVGRLSREVLLSWNALANEVGLSEMDRVLGREWRLEIPFYRDTYVPQSVHFAPLDSDNLDAWFPRIAAPSPTAAVRNTLLESDEDVQDIEAFHPAVEAVPVTEKISDRIPEASIDPLDALLNDELPLSIGQAERELIDRPSDFSQPIQNAVSAEKANFEAIFGVADEQSLARSVIGMWNKRFSTLDEEREHLTAPQRVARLRADWKLPTVLNGAPVSWAVQPGRDDLMFGFFGTWNDKLALGSVYLTVAWGEPVQPDIAPLPQLVHRTQPSNDPNFFTGDSPHLARTRRIVHEVFNAKLDTYKNAFTEGRGIEIAHADFQKIQAPDPLITQSFLPYLPDAYRQPEWAATLPVAQLLPQAAWVFDPQKKAENQGLLLSYFNAQYHLEGLRSDPSQTDPVQQTGVYSQLNTFEQAAGLLWAAQRVMHHDFVTPGIDAHTRWGREFDSTVSTIAKDILHRPAWLADVERDVSIQQTQRHPTLDEPERSVNDEKPNVDFDR